MIIFILVQNNINNIKKLLIGLRYSIGFTEMVVLDMILKKRNKLIILLRVSPMYDISDATSILKKLRVVFRIHGINDDIIIFHLS